MDDTGLWTAAGILGAFQVNALALRVKREIDRGDKKPEEPTWLPPSDWLNLLSIVGTLFGVLAVGAMNPHWTEWMHGCFAASAALLAVYPLALAGHYDLFTRDVRTMFYCTKQEAIAISLAPCTVIGAAVLDHEWSTWWLILLIPPLALSLWAWWSYNDERKWSDEPAL